MADAESKLAAIEKNKLLKEIKSDLKNKDKKNQKGFLKSKQKPGLRLKSQPRATYVIKQYEQEPYNSIYFKREYEKDKRNFFFK